MDAFCAAFGAANVQPALVKLDLMPLQIAHFRSAQAMTIGNQDHGCIAMATSADLASCVHEALHLALGEIAASDCEALNARRECQGVGNRRERDSSPRGD